MDHSSPELHIEPFEQDEVKNITSPAIVVPDISYHPSSSAAATETPPPASGSAMAPTIQKPTDYLFGGKEAWDLHGRNTLKDFLASEDRLSYPLTEEPKLTFIVILYNNAHLSLLSLMSIWHNADVSYELVIVDNCSTDSTSAVLDRIDHATIIRNSTNVGFAPACIQGAMISRGDYFCFLNNDALLEPNSLQPALSNFERDPTVGAVGGKILLADGRLQESGAILWCDGTTNGYGRGADPNELQYVSRRPVDYCSGAFLITPRHLFNEAGGFDDIFAPGYYEDVDYCMRLWQKGFRVLYEPLSTVRHYENAGSANKAAALTNVIRNHQTFWQKWREQLSLHYEPTEFNFHAASVAAKNDRRRILFVAGEVPHRRSGTLYTRDWNVLRQLVHIGQVTCATLVLAPCIEDYVDIPQEVEFMDASEKRDAALRGYVRDYDLIWVSGEPYLADLASALSQMDCQDLEIVLDVGETESQVPMVLFENGGPSKQFGSVSRRDLVPHQQADPSLDRNGRNSSITEEKRIRIWVVS
jgi:GT2 family glycosyltransferase